ncbi:hypothetical protein [Pseudobutyrivibrio sp.]
MGMAFFKAEDEDGNEVTIYEVIGTEFGQIELQSFGRIWAYRVDTSSYFAVNGKLYTNMPDKVKKLNTVENREFAFRKLREAGLMF